MLLLLPLLLSLNTPPYLELCTMFEKHLPEGGLYWTPRTMFNSISLSPKSVLHLKNYKKTWSNNYRVCVKEQTILKIFTHYLLHPHLRSCPLPPPPPIHKGGNKTCHRDRIARLTAPCPSHKNVKT